ncbi:hypothetical protein PV350_13945 [Streptomyces sp. PA03-6a]|nr:hypothetical protein [Streptomyces sp. PA03-6a]
MKTAIALGGIGAAITAVLAALFVLMDLRRRAQAAEVEPTLQDLADVRKLALFVDSRTRLIGWLTMVNAALSLAVALVAVFS